MLLHLCAFAWVVDMEINKKNKRKLAIQQRKHNHWPGLNVVTGIPMSKQRIMLGAQKADTGFHILHQ